MFKHRVCSIYNLSRRLYLKKIPYIPRILRLFNRIIFACDIPYSADIHPTVDFPHNGLGVVVNSKTSIGENSIVYQGVTIGGNGKADYLNGPPMIGKNVIIGANSTIIGPIIIGDNAIIGAGSVVINNVPPNSTVVGSPAKIVKIKS